MPSRFTRREVWLHNSLLGRATFAQKAMLAVINSSTATPEAKATATKIMSLCKQLSTELRKRDE